MPSDPVTHDAILSLTVRVEKCPITKSIANDDKEKIIKPSEYMKLFMTVFLS